MTEQSTLLGTPGDNWPQDLFVATKLYIPFSRSKQVLRSRLLQRVNEGVQGKLTLICAPAGFGKTTLLSTWSEEYGVLSENASSVSWLSLDSGDNDPIRFWSCFIVALERLHPGLGTDALALLHTPQPSPIELALTVLINAFLAYPKQIVLVLDDYQAITNVAIHAALAFLLEHLPPQLHLILACRTEPPLPLARMRSQGQLSEIRIDDLRFTVEETMAFFHSIMGLSLPEEALVTLEQRTEGWIAGLHLAALSLKGRTDISSFIHAFAGSHRYILDYLSDEVMRRQSDIVQTFLLQTSILDRLSGPLCDSVTGQQTSQAILEQLEQANLFIVPLDDNRGWYRYHHLLTDVLRHHLQQTHPEQIGELHRRAAHWYEQAGFISDAVRHALAAKDYDYAAPLMEQAALGMLLQGERGTLKLWIEMLPAQYLQSYPRLSITYAALLAYSFQPEVAESHLHLAESSLQETSAEEASPDVKEMLGEIDSIQAEIAARLRRDFPRAIALSHRALTRIPHERTSLRANIYLNLGYAHIDNGEVEEAQRSLMESLKLSQTVGNLHGALFSLHYLALLHIARGQLRNAYAECQQALQLVENHPEQKRSWHIYIPMGDILRQWNELDRAAHVLTQGIEGCELIGETVFTAHGCVYLAQVRQAQGAQDEAISLMQRAEQIMYYHHFTEIWTTMLLPFQVRLWLAQEKIDRAIQWAQELRPRLENTPHRLHPLETVALIRVLLIQSRQENVSSRQILAEALHLTEQLRQSAEINKGEAHVYEALLLQALVLQEQGKLSQALSTLAHALTSARPERYIRLFIDEGPPMALLLQRALEAGMVPDYVTTLLRALGKEPSAPLVAAQTLPMVSPHASDSIIITLLEPLSERELEVLRLMAVGYSNSEIARTLFVSMGTVKTHLRHIYGKLDVHTRTQALARARQLHLLPS